MQPLRFAIVGAHRGAFAAHVARAFPDQMRVAAICDLRLDRAQSVAQAIGADIVTDDFSTLLAREDIDAVVIATPDHVHAGQAIQALQAGKHVLSEIPAAYSHSELARLIRLSERSGKKYAMGNEVRWFPAIEALKAMDAWGEVFYGEAEYLHNLRAEGWRLTEEDGTPHWRFDPQRPQTTLLGGGPHAFDTLRWLAGETNFTEVFAYGVGEYVAGHPEPATAVCLLKGERGARYKITVSYVMERPYCLYFSLYGSDGSFEGGRARQDEMYFQTTTHPWQKLDVSYWTHPGVELTGGHGTSEYFMMKDFLAAIHDDRPAAIDAREAARSIAPAICAFESIRTGRPVPIPTF